MDNEERGEIRKFKGSDSISGCLVRVVKIFSDDCVVIPEKGHLPSRWPYPKRRTFHVSPSELR